MFDIKNNDQNHHTVFLSGLKTVLGETKTSFPLHEPEFLGHEWDLVRDCLDTGWVSYAGKYVNQFEDELASYTGAKHVIAVVNGTAALHIALLVAGVQANDEVIVPAISFVATANAVSHCGAIPHFVDSEFTSMGLCPDALKDYLKFTCEKKSNELFNINTGRRVSAIVPMHTFGHPVNMAPLLEIAHNFNLQVIEDAAESLGSFYQGQHTGTLGRLGIISFNGNKIITTGGGGAVLTNDLELAKRVNHLTTTAKIPHKWEFYHDKVAYNYRMPNLNAALGCGQLSSLKDKLQHKRKLAEEYKKAFLSSDLIDFMTEPANCVSNYWLNTVRLLKSDTDIRNNLIECSIKQGYDCRPVWKMLSKLPMYKKAPSAETPVAEILEASLISIPSGVKVARIVK